MKFEIKSRWSGAVLFSIETENWKLAVEAGVKAKADLRWASLSGANLSGASLSGANLSWANLREANLYGANLGGADLRGAILSGANLRWANLYGANLSGASLSWADLSGANLSGADLNGANLPSPPAVLSASWGVVSPELCADLMEYDAGCHPDRSAFDRWAAGGDCPYSGVKVQRAANFTEDRRLWGKGKVCTPYNLMTRLLAEKTKQQG